MQVRLERIDEEARRAYERYFFEEICSMSVSDRRDFTVPLPQFEGMYFTAVQDTVERLTEISGRLSKFQWRNCLFAPVARSVRPSDVYAEVFAQLKSKAPSLFVRSYVYLVFIRLELDSTAPFDLGEVLQPQAVRPSAGDYQIYYWNTNYVVRPAGKKNLFGDPGTSATRETSGGDGSSDEDDAASSPEKLFIVENPAHELQRIQDANSDVIDAFRAFNDELPLVAQTQSYLDQISRELDRREDARVLVEGPARSGKTVLAMSLLSRYPKSKMLLMNWYYWDALKDAFKIWSKLSADEIEAQFVMPQKTRESVGSSRRRQEEFLTYQADPRLLDVSLRAMEAPVDALPRWRPYTAGTPTPKGEKGEFTEKVDEFRAIPVKSGVGALVPVIGSHGDSVEIVEVTQKHRDGSATVKRIPGVPKILVRKKDDARLEEHGASLEEHDASLEEQKARLLEYESRIAEGQKGNSEFIAEILKDIADALHDSDQRFFHHDIRPKRAPGCWIERGNPTFCRISRRDLVICDEVQRLGLISEYGNRDSFDEAQAIFTNSRKSFLCGDDLQMLNPIYDQGIAKIERVAGQGIARLRLPDSIGVPAEVGELIKYLLDEHPIPERSSGFEVQLLHRDDVRFVELFEADRSVKKHYAVPNNNGFYRSEPYILRITSRTDKCTPECGPACKHMRIPMLPENLRDKYKFFCSEAVMPNFALSAYELISREVESVYLKIPEEIGLEVVQQPVARGQDRNWKKQHLYVLMTRATMRLVVNVENRDLYDYLSERLRMADKVQGSLGSH